MSFIFFAGVATDCSNIHVTREVVEAIVKSNGCLVAKTLSWDVNIFVDDDRHSPKAEKATVFGCKVMTYPEFFEHFLGDE